MITKVTTETTGNELRNQELNRHEEIVDRNIERRQAVNLTKKMGQAANQNSAIARIVNEEIAFISRYGTTSTAGAIMNFFTFHQ